MDTIRLFNNDPISQLRLLAEKFKSQLESDGALQFLTFRHGGCENYIRSYSPFEGLQITMYILGSTEGFSLEYSASLRPTLEFLYATEGNLELHEADTGFSGKIMRYQNVVCNFDPSTTRSLIFPAGEPIRFLHIRLDHEKFQNIPGSTGLPGAREKLFIEKSLRYFGKFDLHLAEEIGKLEVLHPADAIHNLKIRGRLHLILAMHLDELLLSRTEGGLPNILPAAEIDKIRVATRHIENHVSDPLTVAEISRACGLSSKKLQQGFRVMFTCSVTGYIHNHKLEIARRMLCDTELTVSEIVYGIGMRSRSHFNRIFLDKYGMLPNDYRKHLRRWS